MARKMKSKQKMWRRLANKLTMTIPHKQMVKDEAGNESEVVIPMKVAISGQNLRYMNRIKPKQSQIASNLMMALMARGGLINKDEPATIEESTIEGELIETI